MSFSTVGDLPNEVQMMILDHMNNSQKKSIQRVAFTLDYLIRSSLPKDHIPEHPLVKVVNLSDKSSDFYQGSMNFCLMKIESIEKMFIDMSLEDYNRKMYNMFRFSDGSKDEHIERYLIRFEKRFRMFTTDGFRILNKSGMKNVRCKIEIKKPHRPVENKTIDVAIDVVRDAGGYREVRVDSVDTKINLLSFTIGNYDTVTMNPPLGMRGKEIIFM